MVDIDYFNERKQSSIPFRSYTFEGTYSAVEQLAGIDQSVYVNQGKSVRTEGGIWLTTEGLRECSPLFIKNRNSSESYLAHMMGLRLFDQQQRELRKLSSGDYDVFAVISQSSLVSSVTLSGVDSSFVPDLKAIGIQPHFVGDIAIDLPNSSFGVAFNPDSSLLKVATLRNSKVMEFHV